MVGRPLTGTIADDVRPKIAPRVAEGLPAARMTAVLGLPATLRLLIGRPRASPRDSRDRRRPCGYHAVGRNSVCKRKTRRADDGKVPVIPATGAGFLHP